MSFTSPEFWIALSQIMLINIVLSGDNAVVIAMASRSLSPSQQKKAILFGSAGAIQTENNYPNNSVVSTAEAVRRDLPLNFFMQRYVDAFAAEVEAFVDAVVNDKPVPVGGYDGRMALVVGLAAKKSYAERRPVKVAEIG